MVFESSVLAWIRIRNRIDQNRWIRIHNKSIQIHNPAWKYHKLLQKQPDMSTDFTVPSASSYVRGEIQNKSHKPSISPKN
jgi:hypothetical protein